MKVLNIRNINLKNYWTVDSITINGTYSGLLEGSPHHPLAKQMYDKVVHGITKNTSGFGEQALNRVPRHQPDGLLKRIKIDVDVSQHLEKHANIVTYMDETEELEDVLNEVISDPEFVIGELMF